MSGSWWIDMRHHAKKMIVAVIIGLPLSACGEMDSLYTPDYWNSSSSNAHNLLVEMADRHDLVKGRSDSDYDATLATAAVGRLRAGKVKKLETTNITQIGGQGGGSSQ